MALPNTTTTSAAVGIRDTTVLLASLTNVIAGNLMLIDDEFFKILAPVPAAATTPVAVLRGQEGTAVIAHANAAQVLLGANPSTSVPGDFGQPTAGGPQPVISAVARNRRVLNYGAAGAITLPNPGEDMVAIVDGTGALAMTVAAPSVLNDGDMLVIIGNGKAAHTVSLPAGVGAGAGGSGVDVATFAAGAQNCVAYIAANGVWVPFPSFMGGSSLANITATYA